MPKTPLTRCGVMSDQALRRHGHFVCLTGWLDSR
jgi:hypothetical protein